MFDLFRRREPGRPRAELRDTLFGDLPLSRWPPDSSSAEDDPWRSFAGSRRAFEANDPAAAAASLRRVLSTPGPESRHYLQAWHHLRAVGDAAATRLMQELIAKA